MTTHQCIFCNSEHLYSHGSDRWRCGKCGKTFVKNPKRGRTGIKAENRDEYIQQYYEQNKEEKLTQYLARTGRSKEEYEDNIRVDYDYGRLRSRIINCNMTLAGIADATKIKAPTISKLMNRPPNSMRVKTLRQFEIFFKEKFRL